MQKRFPTSLCHKGPFRANVEFWSPVLQRLPTGSETCLELSPENGDDIHAELRLGFMHKSKSEGEAVDIITASLLIPDNAGQVWSLDSTFSPEAFITHMFDCSALRRMGLISASRIAKRVKGAFQTKPLLNGARVFCDDRFSDYCFWTANFSRCSSSIHKLPSMARFTLKLRACLLSWS